MGKRIEFENDELSVGEISRRSGVAVSTLHFYEAKGLLSSRRNKGNQRRYHRSALRLVSLIKVAQSLGLSLQEIKKALSILPQNGVPSKKEWESLGKSWRHDLDARIKKLTKLRDQLNGCIGCGCLSTTHCPLRNPDDRLADQGPGPQLL